jgi:hypothetical protein
VTTPAPGPRRPRPTPDGRAPANAGQTELQPAQVVAAAGGAIITAARLGRLLGRSGLRMARQLPGAQAVEQEAERFGRAAREELRRIVDEATPQPPPRQAAPTVVTANPEEQRAAYLIGVHPAGGDPLREAMGELLERSVEISRADSRRYLYGSILSQLVPDEARIIAALADGSRYAAIDVVARQFGRVPRTLLANASSVGRAAGVANLENVPTYLVRLASLGLIDFDEPDPALNVQFDVLTSDDRVREAERRGGAWRGGARVVRKAVRLSDFGQEFWTAVDPSRPALPAAESSLPS